MTYISVYRSQDYICQTWKNGKGTTFQIAIGPEDASLDYFDWRLSIAEITEDGPFSSFSDYDRTLVLLDGEGMTLESPISPTVILNGRNRIYNFPGEIAPLCKLHSGKTTDFNVMSRRSNYRHQVIAAKTSAHLKYDQAITKESHTFLLCIDDHMTVQTGDHSINLQRYDLMEIPTGSSFDFETKSDALIIILEKSRLEAAC